MLTAFKSMLHGIVPLALYVAILFTIVASVTKRSQWGLLLLIVLIPQPNIWYTIHGFPLGTRTIDLLLLATILGSSINNGGFERPPRALLIAGFMVLVYVALWNSSLRFGLPVPISMANPLFADFKNYVEMLLLYFVAYNAIKTESDQKTAVALLSAVTLFIAVREIRNFEAAESFSYAKRSAGPFWTAGLDANHFGAWIAYVGAFITGMLIVDRHFRRRMLYGTTLACLIYPLLTSYSRGAYAAFVAALGIFGTLYKRSILVGLAVLAVTWTTVLPSAVVDRISMTQSPEGQIEESAALRFILWERAKELFWDHPVFGIGYEGFSISVRIAGLNNTHNFYMQTACEQGVIGLLFFGVLILFAAASGWRLFRAGQTDFHRGMGLGFLGSLAAVVVGNIFGDRWSYFPLGGYFWILWGLVDRAVKISDAAAQPAPAPQRAAWSAPAQRAFP